MGYEFIKPRQLAALGLAVLLFASGAALASTTDLGMQTAPVSLNFGATYNAPLSQFDDNYLFSISAASVDSVTSTINLGSLLGIDNLQVLLYSGTLNTQGLPSGVLEASSTPIALPGGTGMIAVISPITLDAGNYVLQVTGNVVGSAGGSYAGVLNVAAVPEIAEWAMLLLGMIPLALIALRRKQAVTGNGEMSGMYGVYREGAKVVDTFIHALSWNETLQRISVWSKARESRYVCICNVHSVVTAKADKDFKQALRHADMATPDGMPVAWMLRQLGFSAQERINGPDLMWKYCALAAQRGESVFFYGNSYSTLQRLCSRLSDTFAGLQIGGMYAPGLLAEGEVEDESVIAAINASGAQIVFVSLGCPKQEKWMAVHQGRINAVMIGVGAAFDFHAGAVQRAPLWMQRSGLEWFFRLCADPARLWKRYLVTNTLFIVMAGLQLLLHAFRNVKLALPASVLSEAEFEKI